MRNSMMKKLLLLALLLSVVAFPAMADDSGKKDLGLVHGYAQLGVDVPLYLGAFAGGESGGVELPVYFLLPEAQIGAVIDLAIIKAGIGIKMNSVFGLVNFLYPDLFGEITLDPFFASLNVGGGAFYTFGILGSNFTSGVDLWLGDLFAGIELFGFLRLGVGIFVVTTKAILEDVDGGLFVTYGGAKFAFDF